MTLGPTVQPIRRLAGLWRTWGADFVVAVGETIPDAELVRATIGIPTFWLLNVFLDRSVGPIGQVEALIETGLGGVSGVFPITLFGSGIQAQLPATELVISIRNPQPAIIPYRVVVQVAPVSTWNPLMLPEDNRR
jgi:hypothetical protein